jgi:hypothetical protein
LGTTAFDFVGLRAVAFVGLFDLALMEVVDFVGLFDLPLVGAADFAGLFDLPLVEAVGFVALLDLALVRLRAVDFVGLLDLALVLRPTAASGSVMRLGLLAAALVGLFEDDLPRFGELAASIDFLTPPTLACRPRALRAFLADGGSSTSETSSTYAWCALRLTRLLFVGLSVHSGSAAESSAASSAGAAFFDRPRVGLVVSAGAAGSEVESFLGRPRGFAAGFAAEVPVAFAGDFFADFAGDLVVFLTPAPVAALAVDLVVALAAVLGVDFAVALAAVFAGAFPVPFAGLLAGLFAGDFFVLVEAGVPDSIFLRDRVLAAGELSRSTSSSFFNGDFLVARVVVFTGAARLTTFFAAVLTVEAAFFADATGFLVVRRGDDSGVLVVFAFAPFLGLAGFDFAIALKD